MTDGFDIREGALDQPQVRDLLSAHLQEMHRWSPACKVHAMPVERLQQPDVTFFAAWQGEELAAVGALKQIDGARCEIKSMRAAPAFRGRGAGQAILVHLLAQAKARGCNWIGLETGRHEEFIPGQRLYQKHGFAECKPFGDYVSDDFSLCMELRL